jgi:hypothetical protein
LDFVPNNAVRGRASSSNASQAIEQALEFHGAQAIHRVVRLKRFQQDAFLHRTTRGKAAKDRQLRSVRRNVA